ncbi:hypothetical protein CkaCkLH20_04275 [Colletotrichum karsti]|uniref:Intradiol ring-cleavage dioxygenases domain-containing protein n=1 Tax=Colletotrichum karsti TaxID=1095194 RepID=A0A9P6LN70_9PEZI|nr:uncharacterized protein CkaCkLH20_04275 [Colletotrichum karsti]KAF9878237.1 hypothetical protein CkaCkLH20_04275 [Colletotrichum karsti]
MVVLKTLVPWLLAATNMVSAHPGEDHAAEALRRRAALSKVRSLSACSSALEERGITAASARRRHALASRMQKRTVLARDYDTALNTSHHSNLTGITTDVDPSIIFSGNQSCALVPETTQGPYYVTGEMIRSNVTEDQAGVPLYLDIQFIDVNSCSPVEGVAVDYWSANATGGYSGISSQAGLNTTWLRGIQITDEDGVAGFQGIIPGHYAGRTHHIHLLTHSPGNWTRLPNGTITGGNSTPHIGQVFFDQDLVNEVETLEPYTSNTQSWTKNDEDTIVLQEAIATGVDPMVNYVLLGNSVADGIFAWVSVGIDPTAVYEVDSAVRHTADGGIEDECYEMINLSPLDPALPPLPSYCSSVLSSASASATASAFSA